MLKYKATEIPEGFYVYMLCYPDGIPFYIGKGLKYRAWSHLNDLREKCRNKLKSNIIDKIHRSGKRVKIEIVVSSVSEVTAFEMEKFLIESYGTRYDSTGILSNLSKGGEGPAGAVISQETRKKISESVRLRNSSDDFDTSCYASYGRLGKKNTELTRVKISLSHMKLEHTPENIENALITLGTKKKNKQKDTLAKLRKSQNKPLFINSSEDSNIIWKLADKYWDIWNADKSLGCRKLAKQMNSKYLNVHERLIHYFKLGWIPQEDDLWKEVYHSLVK